LNNDRLEGKPLTSQPDQHCSGPAVSAKLSSCLATELLDHQVVDGCLYKFHIQ